MPRRTVQKCGRRHAGATLSTTDELCLTIGHAFGVRDWEEPLQSQAGFRRLWSQWGTEITTRWIEAYPGSRPAGAYAVGEIEPPAWQHEVDALRHPVAIAGTIVIDDAAWHCREIELDHLVGLGLVGDAEYEAAIQRLAEAEPVAAGRYRSLAPD